MAIAGVLYLTYVHWEDICDIVAEAVDWLGKAKDAVLEFWQDPAGAIGDFLSSIWNAVKSWWESKKAIFNLMDLFGVVTGASGIVDGIKNAILGPTGTDDAALAASGKGSYTNNVEASQINNIYVNGEASKEAIGNAVAGATDNGLVSSYNY